MSTRKKCYYLKSICKYLLIFLVTSNVYSQIIKEKKLKKWIEEIPAFDKAHVAIRVEDKVNIYADYNGSKYMTPASNTKLFTFLAAIQTFDSLPALEYKTVNDSLIKFRSTGYPLLLHPFYPDTLLLDFLSQNKTWKYSVNNKKLDPLGAGWMWDDYMYYYSSEKSVFPIYGNSVKAIKGKGLVPHFELQIDTSYNSLERDFNNNKFYSNPKKWEIKDTLYRPFITSDSLFLKLLSKATNNRIIFEKSNDKVIWDKLYTNHEKELYKALLHDSDNGIAESLLLMISKEIFDEFNTDKAINYFKNKWKGQLSDSLLWVDGSGVSRYNMFTPRTITSILKMITLEVSRSEIEELFPKSDDLKIPSPYSSLSGVFAKTGSLRHNHNLSGYIFKKNGEILFFSIMVNHYVDSKIEIQKGISQLIKKIKRKLTVK
ncbi:MAG: D-alanyl-D-alanine carboxypeptidase [Bacteroidota bacterium]|nr:D-alanyl-D-alanine carboxypeptidase [Bacteroidota bacterium]